LRDRKSLAASSSSSSPSRRQAVIVARLQIPFSKFFLATHARIQDKQFPVKDGGRISSIGITMCDKIDGPFQLEMEWIGVYHDVTHFERFAYENFDTPLIN
jgi:NADH dehydrogenase [ubiquinone] 1 alpha subcomplex assembly factor 1